MVKWIKRVLLGVAVILAVMIAVSAWGWWRLRAKPDWYKLSTATAEQREAAAARVENKFIAAQNWVAAARAREARALQNTPGTRTPAQTSPGAQPAAGAQPDAADSQPFTVSFTAEELNAFFHKWDQLYGWEDRYSKYLQDPAIFIHEGRLILAATLKDFGAVVSFHFQPRLTPEGNLDLDLEQVLAGKLPMPDAMWSSQKDRIEQSLREHLPAWQARAKMDPSSGAPNQSLINAAMAKLALHALNHEPSAPVLFLPQVSGPSLPVKLVGVKVAGDALTLTVEPLTPTERGELVQRVKQPYHPLAIAKGD